ncbi:GON domain-containing protein [Actinokineospora inagensis]|uniref:GON domain-containing protein n=1 Tax=Actinokineospora inagensis TaxID=103730 RepID=UPI001FE01A19|nr:GON domain-containing protein [Actinokineospora inagensis]
MPAASASTSAGLLDSCAALHSFLPGVPDGEYTLATNHSLLGVYCYDMAGKPREYLDLTNVGAGANFSQYTAGGASPGTNVRTSFTKLRVDPQTLTVDINDLTFAKSTGTLNHGGQSVTSMPYAVAMGCGSQGVGNIDLRGTAFSVANAFQSGGFQANGTATPTSNGQAVDLSGGGFCGWIAPAPGLYNPFNPQGANSILKLRCTPDGLFRPQICLDLG